MSLPDVIPEVPLCFRKMRRAVADPDFRLKRTSKLIFEHAIPLADSTDALPVFGLGTWQSKAGEVGPAVRAAIEAGYRHIDCAQAYGNQAEVGAAIRQAIADGIVKREDLWVTTKVWNTFHSYERAVKSIDDTLAEMGLDYVDLTLIHWPHGFKEGGEMFPWNEDKTAMQYSDVDYADTYRALETAMHLGKTRHVGVSNFSIGQIMRLIGLGRQKPQVVQVEMHVYFNQQALRDYCNSQEIALTAYSPLGNLSSPFRTPEDPNVFTDPVITAIAKKHGVPNSHVALRFLINLGVAVIPKSSKAERIRENAGALSVLFDVEDQAALLKLNINKRFIDLKKRDGHHPHFPW